MSASLAPDFIDAALPGEALHALRRQRAKVVDASQAAHDAVFDPALPGLTLAERLEAALVVARATDCEALAACYRRALAACPAPLEGARRDALLGYARTLAERPRDAGRERLLALPAAGLDVDAVITLAQQQEHRSRLAALVDGRVRTSSPEELRGLVSSEITRWRELIASRNLTPD